ncbi:hypothetical protein AY601_0851 [Pedobacter cryoconitis]|uniref:DUF6965 domain-containing protein n=1 Tax=Pedobacter cryoconitis TaxID=188932 RepID=A0A127V8T2_9SPHI|nr:hypothetical protein [Pedobacter cryoconitis]AMP97792.1 hypothetical protein AY601_0851 [Pedobacter cryoconitis]
MSIEELEAYFTGINLPDQIELERGVMVMNVPLFLESHLNYVKINPDLRSAEVFIHRLNQLKDRLEELNA